MIVDQTEETDLKNPSTNIEMDSSQIDLNKKIQEVT